MTPFVHIAMFGILFLSVYLFGKYPARTALTIVVVSGWLLLPSSKTAIYGFSGIPFKVKSNAVALAMLLGIAMKDPEALKRFRPHLLDLPIICWSSAPFFSSVTNGLGPYDGFGAALPQAVDWGIPYLAGRLYFGTYAGLRELGIGMFLGAVAIAPLAACEMIISPQFHILLYGYYPHDFSQAKRGFGYRPSVFMRHGLELAIYNASSVVMGWTILLRNTVGKILPVIHLPTMTCVAGVSVVLLLSRSSGALILCLLALAVVFANHDSQEQAAARALPPAAGALHESSRHRHMGRAKPD